MSEEKKEDKIEDLKVDSCPICCEIYNVTTRKKIKCNFCDYKTCVGCFKKYSLSNISEPHCMSCKKKWSRDYLCSVLTKSFINNDYKKHQENLLLEREKAMMPSTQVFIESKNQAHTYLQMAKEIDKEISKLQEKSNNYMNFYHRHMNRYLFPKEYHRELVEEKKERKEASFNKPCPVNGCRGFINNRWICGVCSVKVCNECHEVKKDNSDHKCDESVVQSIKLLKSECKSCPKCHTMIYKIAGCDQMWCTICKTAFSWTTGKVLTGQVHNPHYFEYLRTIGREDEEIFNRFDENQNICGRRIDTMLRRLTALYRRKSIPSLENNFRGLYNYLQHLYHLDNVEIRKYVEMEDIDVQNIDLRLEYLEQKIDEETLKIKVQRRNKKRLFSENMAEILRMYYDVSLDLINEFIISLETENADWIEFYNKVKRLNEYTNDNINKIKNNYNSKILSANLIYNVH